MHQVFALGEVLSEFAQSTSRLGLCAQVKIDSEGRPPAKFKEALRQVCVHVGGSTRVCVCLCS